MALSILLVCSLLLVLFCLRPAVLEQVPVELAVLLLLSVDVDAGEAAAPEELQRGNSTDFRNCQKNYPTIVPNGFLKRLTPISKTVS